MTVASSSPHDRSVPPRPTATARRDPASGSGIGTLRALAALRIAIGFVFLWAFLDKLLALGFATGRDAESGVVDRFGPAAWINGGSPTEGFLSFGLHTKGPFADLFPHFAGHAWVDWTYMASMLLVGTALMLGVAVRIAAVAGIAWMALFYAASAIWPANNPFVDEHVVYAIALAAVALAGAGTTWGLGRAWARIGAVRDHRWLR